MIKNIKEKLVARFGSVSGGVSILGSWQVCHNICLGIIAVLAALGVTVVGMPLLFLTKIAVPVWTIAFLLLLVTLWIYLKKKCISSKLILFNIGIIIAGIPFKSFRSYSSALWIIGGLIVFASIIMFIRDKFNERHLRK